MNQNLHRGFSLVELLVTCAVLAIVAAIAFMAYGNIAKNGQLIAQNKDQAILHQLLTNFQGTGGNILEIKKIRDSHERAAALTQLFTGNLTPAQLALYNSNKTVKGTVAFGLPKDMMIIPDPNSSVDDNHSKIYIDSNSRFKLVTGPVDSSVGALIAVNINSNLGQAEADYLRNNQSASNTIERNVIRILRNQDTSGTKFADNNAYIWNEDGNTYKRPDASGTDQGTGGQQIISSYLTVTIIIDPSEIPDPSSCTYWQYMAGHLGLRIARFDANDNSSLDIDDVSAIGKVTAQIGTGSVLSLTNFVSSTDAGGHKILVSDSAHPTLLSSVLPPANWTNAADTLLVTATPKDLNTAVGSANADIAVKQLDLRLDIVNSDSDGVFSGSDSIKFRVTKDSSGHAISAADGIVAGIALTDKGGSTVTETYDANSLTDTITP